MLYSNSRNQIEGPMSAQFALESSTAADTATRRQQPLTMEVTSLTPKDNRCDAKNQNTSGRWSRMGEATGECAAVCCCCPCAMLHLFILTVYRLPTDLWRKTKRKRLLRKKRKSSSEETENRRKTDSVKVYTKDDDAEDYRGKNDAVRWDNEMSDRFYGVGFWRSASQKGNDERE